VVLLAIFGLRQYALENHTIAWTTFLVLPTASVFAALGFVRIAEELLSVHPSDHYIHLQIRTVLRACNVLITRSPRCTGWVSADPVCPVAR
jgi:hypothetical protein